MKIDEQESKLIYYAKAIAIFSVICAHSSPIMESAGLLSQISSKLLNYLGTMGVPVFFLISGYLFEKNTKSFAEFWKGKIWSLFIPWIFCETFLWIYMVVRSGDISIKSWFLFIIGYMHTTYYMTMLAVMYLLFFYLRNKWILIGASAISIVAIISQGWQTGISFISQYTGTFYLNPLNWLVFFCVGMLVSRYIRLSVLAEKVKSFIPMLLIISTAYFVWTVIVDEPVTYFSKFGLLPLFVNTLSILSAGYLLAVKPPVLKVGGHNKDYFKEIGVCSYTIYLLHQFSAGIVVKFTGIVDVFILVLLRPLIILVITMLVIFILKRIGGGVGSLLRRLCGVRT